jgi:hypothetical protein
MVQRHQAQVIANRAVEGALPTLDVAYDYRMACAHVDEMWRDMRSARFECQRVLVALSAVG